MVSDNFRMIVQLMQESKGVNQMRLVITDTGKIWNPKNPFLEQFKDIVLVVCLNGTATTDQFECFVPPAEQTDIQPEQYGFDDPKLRMLAASARKLNARLHYHDDVVFLTDNEPSTLYPFIVVKDINEYNDLHLITVSPWQFDGPYKKAAHAQLLSDLSSLTSLLYYSSDEALRTLGRNTTLPEAYHYIRQYFDRILIGVLNGIYALDSVRSFFDFSSMSYLPLEAGFDQLKHKPATKPGTSQHDVQFPTYQVLST